MREGWSYKKLGDLCDIISGRNQKDVESVDGAYPIYGSGGIMGHATAFLCEAGTTIVGRKGTINKPLYVSERFWNVDTAFGLQPKDTTDSKFLFYLCKSIDFTKYDKSVTIPSLVKKDLLKIDVCCPPLTTQQQIVSELDLLSHILDQKRQQLKEYDALAESIFFDMFGDPVENPKGWEVKRWEDTLKIVNGKNQKAVENPNGPYPIYGSGGIMSYADEYLCPENSVIIGRKGNIDKPLFVKTKFWNVDTAFGLVANTDYLTPYYLFYFCKQFDFQKLNKAVTIPSLTKSDLLKILFPLPPLTLQRSFAAKIESIEHQKQLLRASIKETEMLFQSRMDYWFNG